MWLFIHSTDSIVFKYKQENFNTNIENEYDNKI